MGVGGLGGGYGLISVLLKAMLWELALPKHRMDLGGNRVRVSEDSLLLLWASPGRCVTVRHERRGIDAGAHPAVVRRTRDGPSASRVKSQV